VLSVLHNINKPTRIFIYKQVYDGVSNRVINTLSTAYGKHKEAVNCIQFSPSKYLPHPLIMCYMFLTRLFYAQKGCVGELRLFDKGVGAGEPQDHHSRTPEEAIRTHPLTYQATEQLRHSAYSATSSSKEREGEAHAMEAAR